MVEGFIGVLIGLARVLGFIGYRGLGFRGY